jgi:hypothetical protein
MTGKHFFQHKQGDENEKATVNMRERERERKQRFEIIAF